MGLKMAWIKGSILKTTFIQYIVDVMETVRNLTLHEKSGVVIRVL